MNNIKIDKKCSLCGRKATIYYLINGKKYYNCTLCKAIFMDPENFLTVQGEKQRYKKHNNNIYDLAYQEFAAPVVKAITESYGSKSIGLDYGCGPGPVVSKLLNDQGYKTKLYDPFFAYYPENLEIKYEYIICCEVIEHFHNPNKEFDRLFSLLKNGGTIFLKTGIYSDDMNFEKWHYKNDPTHVFFYRKETLEWIEEKKGNVKLYIYENFFKFTL